MQWKCLSFYGCFIHYIASCQFHLCPVSPIFYFTGHGTWKLHMHYLKIQDFRDYFPADFAN